MGVGARVERDLIPLLCGRQAEGGNRKREQSSCSPESLMVREFGDARKPTGTVGSSLVLQIREVEIPFAAGSWRIRDTTATRRAWSAAAPWDPSWVPCICQPFTPRSRDCAGFSSW
jgi:hypothetical protein